MMTQTKGAVAGAPATSPAETKVRYCLYARKSTESEERQILSIDSQVKEMLQIAEIRRESHSAKAIGQRPVFNEIVADVRLGKFNGILTWAADRLLRNAGDLGKLVDLMDEKLLLEIRTYGQRFTNSPNEKFMLMILGSHAKLENDNRGVNVRRGLRTRCEMGLRPGVAPIGYLNSKDADKRCHAIIDPARAPIVKQIFEKVAYEHWSGRKVYHWLKFELNFKSKGNRTVALASIFVILQTHFYYGMFEYPEGSGKWYEGRHEPIITKELFDAANAQLKRDQIVRSELKEFAFTKLITCGLCGSGVTADEKFKQRKDGSTVRYVYYGCTRAKDIHCQSGYLREEDLTEQLIQSMDKIDLNEMHMRQKFEEEVARLNKFQRTFMGKTGDAKAKPKDIDLRDYAKYLLREGTAIEKREFMACIRNRFTLRNKCVELQ